MNGPVLSDMDDDDPGGDADDMRTARIDALFALNPKVQAAGFWGAQVYLHLLLLNKAHDCRGLVPAKLCAPVYLARYLGLDRATGLVTSAAEILRHALQDAASEGLLAIEPDGVRLVGWTKEWSESESADRTRRWREREARESLALARDAGVDPEAHMSADLRDEAPGRKMKPAPATVMPTPAYNPVTSRDAVTLDETPPPPPLGSPSPLPPSYSPPLPSPSDPLLHPAIRPGQSTNQLGLIEAGDLEVDMPYAPAWVGAPVITAPAPPSPKSRKRQLPDEAVTLANTLLEWIAKNHPTSKTATCTPSQRDATALRWADPIDKLHRIDGKTWGEISSMVDWSGRHEFWHRVILSGGNLREHWDKMAAQRAPTKSTARTSNPAVGRYEPDDVTTYDDGANHP